MKHQVSFGWRPPWWLNKVDCCRDDVFPIVASGTFYRGKWELVNFSKRLFPETQTSVSGFLFVLKQSNRAFKYLVSVLEKSFSITFSSQVMALFIQWGPFFIHSGPFSYSWGPFSYRPDSFYSVRPFSSRSAFLCWMGYFFKQKGPLTPNAWPGYKKFKL